MKGSIVIHLGRFTKTKNVALLLEFEIRLRSQCSVENEYLMCSKYTNTHMPRDCQEYFQDYRVLEAVLADALGPGVCCSVINGVPSVLVLAETIKEVVAHLSHSSSASYEPLNSCTVHCSQAFLAPSATFNMSLFFNLRARALTCLLG